MAVRRRWDLGLLKATPQQEQEMHTSQVLPAARPSPLPALLANVDASRVVLAVEPLGDHLLAVVGVAVLDRGDHEAGGSPGAGNVGGPAEEKVEDPVPPLAVLGNHLVLVLDPVVEPVLDGERVVDADGVDLLDLEASELELADDPPEGHRGVGARENVLGHEEAPHEVLILEGAAEAGNLEVEGAVILKKLPDLAKELLEVLDADVLGHLEAGNLVKLLVGNVAVVHAEEADVLLGPVLLRHAGAVPHLVLCKGDAGRGGAKVLGSIVDESAPTAANVEMPLSLLELDVVAHQIHLVVLHLLEVLVAVERNSRGVDHAVAEEGAVEVILCLVPDRHDVAAVIVVLHLLLVLPLRVSESLGDPLGQEVPHVGGDTEGVGDEVVPAETKWRRSAGSEQAGQNLQPAGPISPPNASRGAMAQHVALVREFVWVGGRASYHRDILSGSHAATTFDHGWVCSLTEDEPNFLTSRQTSSSGHRP